MQKFSGLEYIKLDVVNNYGLDKLTWNKRLDFFNDNKDNLDKLTASAEKPSLVHAGICAYRDALNGIPTGFIMGLDATASGLQIMACLTGCIPTAKAVNLFNTGGREDIYLRVAEQMNKNLDERDIVIRSDIKKNVMTKYYNKTSPDGLNSAQELAFSKVLHAMLPGPDLVMDLVNQCWNKTAFKHNWKAPDGHNAIVPVLETKDTKIEVDELDHTTFTYRFSCNQPSRHSASLVPNLIHSLDGWIARQMVKLAFKQGFQLVHIHDQFWVSPNYMNQVRQNFKDILCDLVELEYLRYFLEHMGKKYLLKSIPIFNKKEFKTMIQNSEYALS